MALGLLVVNYANSAGAAEFGQNDIQFEDVEIAQFENGETIQFEG